MYNTDKLLVEVQLHGISWEKTDETITEELPAILTEENSLYLSIDIMAFENFCNDFYKSLNKQLADILEKEFKIKFTHAYGSYVEMEPVVFENFHLLARLDNKYFLFKTFDHFTEMCNTTRNSNPELPWNKQGHCEIENFIEALVFFRDNLLKSNSTDVLYYIDTTLESVDVLRREGLKIVHTHNIQLDDNYLERIENEFELATNLYYKTKPLVFTPFHFQGDFIKETSLTGEDEPLSENETLKTKALILSYQDFPQLSILYEESENKDEFKDQHLSHFMYKLRRAMVDSGFQANNKIIVYREIFKLYKLIKETNNMIAILDLCFNGKDPESFSKDYSYKKSHGFSFEKKSDESMLDKPYTIIKMASISLSIDLMQSFLLAEDSAFKKIGISIDARASKKNEHFIYCSFNPYSIFDFIAFAEYHVQHKSTDELSDEILEITYLIDRAIKDGVCNILFTKKD